MVFKPLNDNIKFPLKLECQCRLRKRKAELSYLLLTETQVQQRCASVIESGKLLSSILRWYLSLLIPCIVLFPT